MGSSDLIFRELVKRGYSLEGDTRVWNIADSKLWYLTSEQAQGFLDVETDPEYKQTVIDKEEALIKKHLEDLLKVLPNVQYNLMDLGCGDGKKAALFIEKLRSHIGLRYCPIDISSYMVERAAETIKKRNLGEVVEFKWNISDFENLSNITPLLRHEGYQNNLMMLLGNTLGNFEIEDLLQSIRSSMASGDRLLIGNGVSDGRSEKEWIETYRNPIINDWMIKTIKLIGLEPEDVEYDVRFVNSRIEEIYILKHAKKVRHLWRTIEFKKGDIIVTIVSAKYSLPQLKSELTKFFPDTQVFTDEEDTYALALCCL